MIAIGHALGFWGRNFLDRFNISAGVHATNDGLIRLATTCVAVPALTLLAGLDQKIDAWTRQRKLDSYSALRDPGPYVSDMGCSFRLLHLTLTHPGNLIQFHPFSPNSCVNYSLISNIYLLPFQLQL